MNPTRELNISTGESRNADARRATLREGEMRAAAILILAGACVATLATGRSSAIRVIFTLSFLLLGPGLALAELLEIRDLAQRMAIATGASLGIETLVAVALVYARAFSLPLAIGILEALTIAAVLVALRRARRSGLVPADRYTPHR